MRDYISIEACLQPDTSECPETVLKIKRAFDNLGAQTTLSRGEGEEVDFSLLSTEELSSFLTNYSSRGETVSFKINNNSLQAKKLALNLLLHFNLSRSFYHDLAEEDLYKLNEICLQKLLRQEFEWEDLLFETDFSPKDISLLYVDSYPKTSSRDYQQTKSLWIQFVLDCLRSKYKAESAKDFHSPLLEVELAKESYDVLLTHFPYDKAVISGKKTGGAYDSSSERLKQITANYPHLNIIIFTGAFERSVTDEMLYNLGVKGVVRKKTLLPNLKEIIGYVDEIAEDSL